MKSPQVREPLVAAGAEPVGSKPDVFAQELRDELEKWQKVTREARIEPR
jgi:tripartite-type tricarboxylate transporter receptor subunit TctC